MKVEVLLYSKFAYAIRVRCLLRAVAIRQLLLELREAQ
jgi:hypothetical protein